MLIANDSIRPRSGHSERDRGQRGAGIFLRLQSTYKEWPFRIGICRSRLGCLFLLLLLLLVVAVFLLIAARGSRNHPPFFLADSFLTALGCSGTRTSGGRDRGEGVVRDKGRTGEGCPISIVTINVVVFVPIAMSVPGTIGTVVSNLPPRGSICALTPPPHVPSAPTPLSSIPSVPGRGQSGGFTATD